jgi:hypothetical protein
MGWDGVALRAFADVAAIIISAVLLLLGVGCAVPVMGLVAGVAVMLEASIERASSSASRLSGGGHGLFEVAQG